MTPKKPHRKIRQLLPSRAARDGTHPFILVPDVEPTDLNQSVFEIMRKAFHTEDLFSDQLNACLRSAQARKHLKLELQLKMVILSANQRCRLLEDRYGYARTKSVLFQGLRRQTTRFLSALNGEKRTGRGSVICASIG